MSPSRHPDSRPWGPRDTHPRSVLHPEHSGHQILICCARHKLHLHEAILLPAWLWPVLQAGLGHRQKAEWSRTSPHPSASSGDSTMAQCLALASPAAHLSLHCSPIRTQGHCPGHWHIQSGHRNFTKSAMIPMAMWMKTSAPTC